MNRIESKTEPPKYETHWCVLGSEKAKITIDFETVQTPYHHRDSLALYSNGNMSPKFYKKYLQWAHGIMSDAAKKSGRELHNFYQQNFNHIPPDRFLYYPDGRYERIK